MTSVLLVTVGSRGDVQPFVALAKTLKARGHDVTLSTGTGFEDLVEKSGVSSAPLSIDIQAMIDMPEVQNAMHSLRGKWRAYQASKFMTRQLNEEIWQIMTDLKPDIAIYSPKGFMVHHAARAIGTTAVPAFLQPAFAATKAFPSPLLNLPFNGPLFNRISWALLMPLLRFGHRLAIKEFRKANPTIQLSDKVNIQNGYSPTGKVVPRLFAHSQHLVPKPDDWAKEDHVTGAWFAELGENWKAPDDLNDFLDSGPPPVYIGFGSMPSSDEAALATLITEALEKTGTRALIARGWGALDHMKRSERVHVLDSAPHDWLFPKCAGVVHHGGAGTTHEGLRWGRPTFVCPVFGDQPFWANVVHSLGAGPEPVSHKKLTVENFSRALEALRSPDYANAAGKLGEAIRREEGTMIAAKLIEQVGGNGS